MNIQPDFLPICISNINEDLSHVGPLPVISQFQGDLTTLSGMLRECRPKA